VATLLSALVPSFLLAASPAAEAGRAGGPHTSAAGIVLDDAQAELSGDWELFRAASALGGWAARTGPGSGGSVATYRPALDQEGIYEISLRCPAAAGALSADLPVFVRAADRMHHARVNLRAAGGAWRSIGEYRLGPGAEIAITDMGDGDAVADAVRLVLKRPASTPGRTFYAAPGGSDANPGTPAAPWATLRKAAAMLEAGDTVYLRAGSYAGGVAPLRSGSDHRCISFRAAPGETPVVSGGTGHGFDLSGKGWIRIEGFRVEGNAGNGIHLGEFAHDIEILDCELDGNGGGNPWSAGLMLLRGCSQVYVRGCRARDNTGFGFASDKETPRASFVTLEQCEARRNGNDGFGLYAERALLTGCVSRDNGWNIDDNGDGFDLLHSRDAILYRCLCVGNDAYAFKLGAGRSVLVNCLGADTQGEGYGRYPGIAFLGADSSGIAANCGVRGISMAGAGPYAIRNCVIRKNGNSSPISAAIYCENDSAPLSSDYNLFLPDVRYGVNLDPLCHRGPAEGGVSYRSLAEWQAAGFDRHASVSVESPYANEVALDFRPRPGSAAIDAGTSDGAPGDDFAGCARRWSDPPGAGAGSRPYHDIGAVESRGDGPCAAPLALLSNGTVFPRGARLRLAAAVQPTSRRFDAYAVLAGPAGTYSILPGGRLAPGIRPYAQAVRGLEAETRAALLEIEVPANIRAGAWTVHAGLVPPHTPPALVNAFALDTVRLAARD
jgi:hypothetical protein